MATQPTITRSHLDDRVRGRVIVPGDDDYDERRTVFLGGIDRRPAAIVMAADADDVARTVMFASETGAELAVRSGGHSGAGHSTTDGGIVLDLRDLNALEIDVDARTAWVQPGLTAAEYTREAGTHGLATGFGDAGSVGIGGITVGGGVGFLSRKYGLTIDDLLAAEVVTADGRIRQVDADHEPDLFWAIRGGGGNFGVVTRLQLRLHPVGTVVGGMLMLPATADVIAGFIAEADRAPDELSTIANVMPAPPAPFVPEAVQGTLVVLAFMTFAGEAEAGEQALAPFRALAEPIADMLGAIPYPQMYMPEDEDYHPVAISRTMFVDGVDHAVADHDHGTPRGVRRLDAGRAAPGPRRRHRSRPGRRDRVRAPRQQDHGEPGHLRRQPGPARCPARRGSRHSTRRCCRAITGPTSTS